MSDPALVPLLREGDVLDARYRIEALLGGGGMAQVYRATHTTLEQPVAVKVLAPEMKAIPGVAARFLREAKAATLLKGQHVVRVFDVGTTPDQTPYLVMELLEGRDLDMVLEMSGPLPIHAAVDYAVQACEALAEVHGRGIVHRDLKPANLFLTTGADGLPCIKLIDFGISRVADSIGATQPDAVMGSPRYMPPEQMESAASVDARSDIYALGAVLYELLTGRSPFDGETLTEIFAAARGGPPPAPSELRDEVPEELDAVVMKCLRFDPAERFADVVELAHALAPFGYEHSATEAAAVGRVLEQARGGGSGERSVMRPMRVRRHRRVMEVVGLAAITAVGMYFGARTLGHSTPAPEPTPVPIHHAEVTPPAPAGATVSSAGEAMTTIETAPPAKPAAPATPAFTPRPVIPQTHPTDLFEDRK